MSDNKKPKWMTRINSCPGCGYRYHQTISEIVEDLKEIDVNDGEEPNDITELIKKLEKMLK